jgi:hypothetical protein
MTNPIEFPVILQAKNPEKAESVTKVRRTKQERQR